MPTGELAEILMPYLFLKYPYSAVCISRWMVTGELAEIIMPYLFLKYPYSEACISLWMLTGALAEIIMPDKYEMWALSSSYPYSISPGPEEYNISWHLTLFYTVIQYVHLYICKCNTNYRESSVWTIRKLTKLYSRQHS